MSPTSLGLFYNSYDLSSKAFCLAWILATSWYLILNMTRSKIRNYFRIRTTFETAHYIQIEKSRKIIQMTSNDHPLKKLENFIRSCFGFDVLVMTVPVMKNKHHCYFEFQSTRYNLIQSKFLPAVIHISLDPKDLLNMHQGLTDTVAQSRLETLGPNFIEVKVPSFLKAFWQE